MRKRTPIIFFLFLILTIFFLSTSQPFFINIKALFYSPEKIIEIYFLGVNQNNPVIIKATLHSKLSNLVFKESEYYEVSSIKNDPKQTEYYYKYLKHFTPESLNNPPYAVMVFNVTYFLKAKDKAFNNKDISLNSEKSGEEDTIKIVLIKEKKFSGWKIFDIGY